MKLNKKTKNTAPALTTHEGGRAKHISAEQQLRRSVMSCMLWENEFYESGETISQRIASLIPKVKPGVVAQIAKDARDKMHLRHVPLFICREMVRHYTHKGLVSATLSHVIQRADELCESLAIYWKDGRKPIANQFKLGLSKAFNKFNAYSLQKYNRDNDIKLRDVLFLTHPKPKDKEQEKTWKQLVDNTLPTPETWEVLLSGGKDKKQTWTKLLKENALGGLATLRNLRNMTDVGVDENLIKKYLQNIKTERILPFRFIAAAKHAPQFEPQLEEAMFKCLQGSEKLTGKTVLLVDVSGSMSNPISSKSDLNRMDAAFGLAMLLREVAEDVEVYSFSDYIKLIPARRGFALAEAIKHSQNHVGTNLGMALDHINKNVKYDRLIVISDEQSHDNTRFAKNKSNYMINIASNKNGVGYGSCVHIDGWSEAVVGYIIELEKSGLKDG